MATHDPNASDLSRYTPEPSSRVLDVDDPYAGPYLIQVCCWCKPHREIRREPHPDRWATSDMVSHGICPECERREFGDYLK